MKAKKVEEKGQKRENERRGVVEKWRGDNITKDHRPEVYDGIEESAAAALLRDFFAARR